MTSAGRPQYRITPHALLGLRDIVHSVEARFGPALAERVLDRFECAFELIAERPAIGKARPELTYRAEIRFWPVGPSLIAYRRVCDTVEVLLVERGERDWAPLLAKLG